MVIRQGDVWWADMPDPVGSGPGFRRPVVVIQGDPFNRSRIATVVCVPITSNLRLGGLPGNVVISAGNAGLANDSVANPSQVISLDRRLLTERVGELSRLELESVMSGLDVVLGRLR